jgi:hypothetical protein
MCVVKIPNGKTLSREEESAAFGLWKAKFFLKEIRSQLQISEATLRRILTVAKNNLDDPGPDRKARSGKKSKISPSTMMVMKAILMNKPTITSRKLKDRLAGLADVSVRTIQNHCLKTMKMLVRKMANKPLLTEKLKAKRLEFANQYQHCVVEE